MEILNPNEWRISKSGFSIKTGWADEKKIIAKYPGAISPIDNAEFQAWMDNAEMICKLHNDSLRDLPPSEIESAGRAVALTQAEWTRLNRWQCKLSAAEAKAFWGDIELLLSNRAAPAELPEGYVPVPKEMLDEWYATIHNDELAVGDRLQRISARISNLSAATGERK